MEKFFYRVKKGETLLSITQKHCVSIFCALAQNNLTEEVCEGDLLYLEKCQKPYSVLAQDTFSSVAKKLNISLEKLKKLNGNPPYIFYGIILETQS